MNLKHFFDGQQSRENSASAFLATLLEYDDVFRRRFLALENIVPRVTPPLDDSEQWTIKVEDYRPWTTPLPDVEAGSGSIDITLETPSTLVLVENKLVPSAKRYGQLRRYYEAATGTWPDKRIVALYLAPTAQLGASEVALVKESDAFRGRTSHPAGPDDAGAITWGDVQAIIEGLPGGGGWFASSGIFAVQAAIDEAAYVLSTEGQRGVVRDIMEAARNSLAATAPGVRLGPWHGRLYELIYTAKAPVTMYLGAHFAAESEKPYRPIDVVADGRVRLTVGTSFALSPKGRKSPALVDEWAKLLKTGSVKVGGIGDFAARDGKTFVHRQAFDGTETELVDLLVERGGDVLGFLSPYFALAITELGRAAAPATPPDPIGSAAGLVPHPPS